MYSNGVVLQSLKHTDNVTYKTIHIEKELYSKTAELAKKSNTNLRKYVNDMISYMVEREEILNRMEPFLHIISAQESSIFIKDAKADKVAEVVLNVDKQSGKVSLHCRLDEGVTDCIHVAYASASNELGRLHQ